MSEKVVELATERIPLLEVIKSADVDALMADIEDEGIRDIDPASLKVVRKAFVSVEAKSTEDEDERTATAYISTNAIDRDNEILLAKGADLKHFKKNPIVLYGHDYDALPIGRALWVQKDGKGLLAKTKFATHARAEDVWQLYREKILRAWSVGFLPIKSHVPEGDEFEGAETVRRIYDKWVLLEYSAVAVPSNYEALTTAVSKGLVGGWLTEGKDSLPSDEDSKGSLRLDALDERLAEIERHIFTLVTPKTMPAPAGIYVTHSPNRPAQPTISTEDAKKIAVNVATQVLAAQELAQAQRIKRQIDAAFGRVYEV